MNSNIIPQLARDEILRMGPKKYAQLRDKADKLVKRSSGRGFTDKERMEFLSLPLAIRVLAVYKDSDSSRLEALESARNIEHD